MSIMKVWQLTLILTKQDSLGRGHTENWAFLHSSDEKAWFLTFPLVFKWTPMGGLKKLLSMSILKVWQLTLIQQNKTPWGEVIQKKRLFYTLLMRKHDFWPFHWFSNGHKWGCLKNLLSMSILKVWQLTLILAKQDSLGRGYTEKMAFLHSSDEKTWFLTFPLIFKWSPMGGLKKLLSMSILKVWQLTLILTKQDSLGRGYTEKMAFLHSSDEKTWFLTFPLIFKWSKMGGLKKLLSMSILKVWQLTLIQQSKTPWGEVI